MRRSAKTPAVPSRELNAATNPSQFDGLESDGVDADATPGIILDTTYPGQDEGFLSTDDAAKFLGLSPHTLSKWRITGRGPPYHLLGRRCLYSPDVLRRWSATKVRKSTSDPGVEFGQ